ncbi:MAG: Uma2 family endonuclease [Hyphomicrobiales bacterium]|nr:MAG: Uma2 family endonuclease [Hyphomicrobiales bacterium]
MLKSKVKSPPATYADLEALPPNMVGEIIFGALHAHPRPHGRHGGAAIELGAELSNPFRRGRGGPGGWFFSTEPELHLGPHVLVPDIAGWHTDRLPKLPATYYIETPPDWLAEILSPSTQAIDRTDKLTIYAEFGVKHCWYLDPIAKTLEVLALKGTIHSTFKGDATVAAPPFEVHSFALDVLWYPEET